MCCTVNYNQNEFICNKGLCDTYDDECPADEYETDGSDDPADTQWDLYPDGTSKRDTGLLEGRNLSITDLSLIDPLSDISLLVKRKNERVYYPFRISVANHLPLLIVCND